MTNTEVIKISEELGVTIQDVWNVYLNRAVKIDNVVKARIDKRIKKVNLFLFILCI